MQVGRHQPVANGVRRNAPRQLPLPERHFLKARTQRCGDSRLDGGRASTAKGHGRVRRHSEDYKQSSRLPPSAPGTRERHSLAEPETHVRNARHRRADCDFLFPQHADTFVRLTSRATRRTAHASLGSMIDPGVAAVIAAGVSLLLGLASMLRSTSDSRQTQLRESRRHRAEAYVDVLRIVEIRGLAVQDEMYNYTERGADPYDPSAPRLPKRELQMPPAHGPRRSSRSARRIWHRRNTTRV